MAFLSAQKIEFLSSFCNSPFNGMANNQSSDAQAFELGIETAKIVISSVPVKKTIKAGDHAIGNPQRIESEDVYGQEVASHFGVEIAQVRLG
jgi:hypothetical protein